MSSDFAQGLMAGQRTAQGWIETYDAAQKQREEEALRKKREEIMAARPEALGLQPSGAVPFDGQPMPQPEVGLSAPQAAAAQRYRFLGQEYDNAPTPERQQLLREQALVGTIRDPMQRIQAQRGLQDTELNQYRLAEAKTSQETAAANKTAMKALSQVLATGKPVDVPVIHQLASDNGADFNVLLDATAKSLNLTTAQINATAANLTKQIGMAATDPAKFSNLLRTSFDPDPNDNMVPELRNVNGAMQVFYGDKPISRAFKDTPEVSALQQLAGFYTDTINNNPTATTLQLMAVDAKKQERELNAARLGLIGAQIGQANAAANRDHVDSLESQIRTMERQLGRPLTAEEKLSKFGLAAKPGKDVELPAAGTRVRRPDGSVAQADGYGGYVALKGVLPDDQPQKLAELKVPPYVAEKAQWSRDGTMLGFNNVAYPLTEAGVKALTKAVALAGNQGIAADERLVAEQDAAARVHAGRAAQAARDAAVDQQATTGLYRPTMGGIAPNPRAPRPSAPQEEWLAYRESQRLRAQQNQR